MADSETRPQLSLVEAIVPVASLILLVGLSYYLFGDGGANGPNQVGMVVATMIAVVVGWAWLAVISRHLLNDPSTPSS